MQRLKVFKATLVGGAAALILSSAAHAQNFNVPSGDLDAALAAYSNQSGIELIVSAAEIKGIRTRGAVGDFTATAALNRILSGTGFSVRRNVSGKIGIAREDKHSDITPVVHLADAAPVRAAASVETVVVTSSKIKGDIQTVPIAITALSQEQLTSRQIAGGPDLVKEVPNLTFSKTNFTGYNIEIRGIGTQAISVTTDPAVAVAFNDIPFIRNHFFEQEFYDVSQVEVLRGPQGTLYGRNATAGVVNVISNKPTDQFEAMLSADWGNYHNRRYEGMINIPLVDDRLDIRLAGEWTKRDGYSFNTLTGQPIDGRDLWSSRFTVGWKPVSQITTYFVWEHFQENDDRIRSGKQLCKTDPGPSDILGVPVPPSIPDIFANSADYLSTACSATSLYSPDAFEVPNGFALPYVLLLYVHGTPAIQIDPYLSKTQSRNLRVIESSLNPSYRAKNDTLEFNADYALGPNLTLTSQTGFNKDSLWSTEDYNRFNTSPGIFDYDPTDPIHRVNPDGTFCDPQLGCSNRLVAEDLSDEHAWQGSEELRLASNFNGPLNFSVGGNYLHYETDENYYVFFNSVTLFAAGGSNGSNGGVPPWNPGVSDNSQCLMRRGTNWFQYGDPASGGDGLGCMYIDPNPITSLNNKGHNYFLSQNPYILDSYAGFGETYYSVNDNLKITAGLRWTSDHKHFLQIPSWLAAGGYGYPLAATVDQGWNEWTGRFATDWSPKLDFTDQTLVYASYAHGYKAGGANPPGAVLLAGAEFQPTHPLTFEPEFIDAYELGTKNTLLDSALTLNGDLFFYNYKGYQISQIVDRTSVNLNFDASVKGAELETTWQPAPGLKFTFAGGYENAKLANGSKAIDLMDRTAGHPGWVVVRPFITQASNCILPAYVIAYGLEGGSYFLANGAHGAGACGEAYALHDDPLTGTSYTPNPGYPVPDYPGFDPLSIDPSAPPDVNNGLGLPPNNGAGFDKDLSGNGLPNAPHFTTSLTAEYSLPVSDDWAATLHGDFYWQSQSWARVFNDRPYDKIRGNSNVNLALIMTSANGWQVMGYLKNVFNTTAITGAFLNSDDSGLTTNVFLTDPRLYGVRVTKNF